MSSAQCGPPASYAAAGVDIDAAERARTLMGEAMRASHSSAVLGRPGQFGAAVLAPGGGTILVSSTDGVGTKVLLARTDEEAAGVGRDLVHHCFNDILTCGALPLFFLDYLAFARLDTARAAALVRGMAAACARFGCALVGGETAQMPDIYREGAYDVAGFVVGSVPPDRLLDGSRIGEGDALIGLPSAGLHTNGYTLARRLLGEDLDTPVEGGHTVRELLMAEHRCYVDQIAPLLERDLLHGMAHITGGGLPGNVPRMLPERLAASLDTHAWEVPPIIGMLARHGVTRNELYRTFNMGIGMVLACDAARSGEILNMLGEGVRIGTVVAQRDTSRVLGL
jgi:phosphoribosylformylglycinamidine cyclo-ligase